MIKLRDECTTFQLELDITPRLTAATWHALQGECWRDLNVMKWHIYGRLPRTEEWIFLDA